MLENKPINIQITAGTIIKGLAILIAIYALYRVRDIVLILLTALVIASAIEPGVRWLRARGLPRVLAVLLIYLSVVAVMLTITLFFVPPMLAEISHLSDILPKYLSDFKLSGVLSNFLPEQASLVGDQFINAASIQQAISQVQGALAGLSNGFFQTLAIVFGGAVSALLIVVISFYLAVEERGIENFLRVIIPMPREQYVLNLWKRTQEKIGRWLQGQLLLGIVMGVLVYLGLTILHVPYATVLAVLAALLEVMPVFGPIIAAIPAAIAGFSVSASLGLMVIGLYLILQQFENHLIVPLVITKIVGIPSIIVIIALLVGAKLGGFLGIILAVPMCTILVEVFNDLERHKLEGKNS